MDYVTIAGLCITWHAHSKRRKHQRRKNMLRISNSRDLLRWLCDDNSLPLGEKTPAQAYEGRARGESSLGAAAAPGHRLLDEPTSRAHGSRRRSGAMCGLSKERCHCSVRPARGQKSKTRVRRLSTSVSAFSRAWQRVILRLRAGPAASNQGRKPA